MPVPRVFEHLAVLSTMLRGTRFTTAAAAGTDSRLPDHLCLISNAMGSRTERWVTDHSPPIISQDLAPPARSMARSLEIKYSLHVEDQSRCGCSNAGSIRRRWPHQKDSSRFDEVEAQGGRQRMLISEPVKAILTIPVRTPQHVVFDHIIG